MPFTKSAGWAVIRQRLPYHIIVAQPVKYPCCQLGLVSRMSQIDMKMAEKRPASAVFGHAVTLSHHAGMQIAFPSSSKASTNGTTDVENPLYLFR